MSRALFSDPDVAKRLKAEFVAAATGIETLANLDPSVLGWFTTMAAKAVEKAGTLEEWKKNPIFQGIYVAGADGTAYAQVGDWERERFLKALDRALEDFRKRPPKPVELGEAEIQKGAPRGPDLKTSVIRLYSRCDPLPKDAHPVNRSIGRDHLWIYADEVREIARTDQLPRQVASRIARFHLVDNVRGLADAWAAGDLSRRDFTLAFVREKGGLRTYSLVADVAAEKDYPGDVNFKGKLGVEGRLEAEFDIDVGKSKIVRFRGCFDGKAWGANTNTWHQPKGKFPLRIALTDVDDEVSRVIGPVWRDYGLDYDR